MQRIVHRYDPPERFVAGTVGEPGARTFFLQAREGRRVTSVSLEKEQVAVLAGRVEQILAEAAQTSPEVAAAIDPVGSDDADPLDAPISEDFRVGTLVLAWQAGAVPGTQRLVIQAYAMSEPDPTGSAADDVDGPAASAVEPAVGSGAELAALEAEVDAVRAEVAADAEALAELAEADMAAAELEAAGVDGDATADPLEPVEEDTDALVVRLDVAAASAFARRCAAVVSAGRPPCPFCGRPLDPAGHLCPRANGYRPARR